MLCSETALRGRPVRSREPESVRLRHIHPSASGTEPAGRSAEKVVSLWSVKNPPDVLLDTHPPSLHPTSVFAKAWDERALVDVEGRL